MSDVNFGILRPFNLNIQGGYSKNALRKTYDPMNVALKNSK